METTEVEARLSLQSMNYRSKLGVKLSKMNASRQIMKLTRDLRLDGQKG